jgi:hypothetical protein
VEEGRSIRKGKKGCMESILNRGRKNEMRKRKEYEGGGGAKGKDGDKDGKYT